MEKRIPESEAQLKAWMLGGLDGDADAHAALLHALVPLLHSFYRRRMRDAEENVEDQVQETLISVHTRRASYDRNRPFTAWPYAVARYRLVDHYRRRKLSVSIEDVEEILAVESFEERVTARLDVDNLLSTLSPKQARAISDTHIDGKCVAEAANLTQEQMESSLAQSPWLVERVSMADIALAPYVNRLHVLAMARLWSGGRLPHLESWFQRIREGPTFQASLVDWVPADLDQEMRRNGEQAWPQIEALLCKPVHR